MFSIFKDKQFYLVRQLFGVDQVSLPHSFDALLRSCSRMIISSRTTDDRRQQHYDSEFEDCADLSHT